ncbi:MULTISPECIES: response regulator [unclassified Azospirillum]|uniref:response regulator n=1 Tax=unclassified Azospirillum TaxID=2630922 RepID=UPI000B65D850|nr:MULTISPECIES: response regulator [unclassified Azospirillum]SNS77692.1 two-component system, OmpR family, response regulator [Azospirillum sp. RU38E]SNS94861.1 two-component system, OmpR family, response regulator [Azospirillum sp. RU37A]
MSSEAPHILVVDDHRDIRETLGRFLEKHGMRITTAEDAAMARRRLRAAAVDLIVLDVMMPGEDGLSLFRHIRETMDTPVIFLTAIGEPMDRIVGLEMGADDYVTKPFEPRELLARIRAVLRRSHSLPVGGGRKRGEETRLAFDRWVLDLARRELTGEDGVVVSLSTAEFSLLEALVRHPNMVLSREQLLDLTKGREADVFDRSIDNQVSRLRRKIEPDSRNPSLIKTVWGGGYCLAAAVTPAP